MNIYIVQFSNGISDKVTLLDNSWNFIAKVDNLGKIGKLDSVFNFGSNNNDQWTRLVDWHLLNSNETTQNLNTSSSTSRSSSSIHHFYLYSLSFETNNFNYLDDTFNFLNKFISIDNEQTVLNHDNPLLNNSICQFNNTKFILSSDPNLFNDNFLNYNNTKWKFFSNLYPSKNLFNPANGTTQPLDTLTVYQDFINFIKDNISLKNFANFSNLTWINDLDSFNFFVITLSYLTVFHILINLFYDMKSIGSRIWLSFATLINLTCSICLAISTQFFIFNQFVPLKNLFFGLPFILIFIGFKQQINLTKLTLNENNKLLNKITKLYDSDDDDDDDNTDLDNFTDESVLEKKLKYHHDSSLTNDKIIYKTILNSRSLLIKDNLILLITFVCGILYSKKLAILKKFCSLCSLILIYQLLLTCTFYTAILSLKLEINSIYRSTLIKQTLEEDSIFFDNKGSKDKSKINNFNNPFFHSETTIKLGKIILLLFIFGNIAPQSIFSIYNLLIRPNLSGYNSIDGFFQYTNNTNKIYLPRSKLLNLIQAKQNGLPVNPNDSVLITMLPMKIYYKSNFYYNLNDYFMEFLHLFSKFIRDRLVSKLILFLLLLSCSINIYLLNIAKFHSNYTVAEFINRKNIYWKDKMSKSTSLTETGEVDTANDETTKEDNNDNANDTKTKKKTKKNKKKKNKKVLIVETETSSSNNESTDSSSQDKLVSITKPLTELIEIMKQGNLKELNNTEVTELVVTNNLPLYALEKQLQDTTKAVEVRRQSLAILSNSNVLTTERLPYKHYDYDRVFGACCENVIGYMPLPVGIIGPLIIDDIAYHIPMATTEGCLVASAMRGCKAINAGGGVITVLTKDGMTRGPCVRFPNLKRAGACKIWLDSEEGQMEIKKAFNSTSRFARLQHIQTALAGTLLFIRFRTTTGDAMGMNMISKGVEHSLNEMVNTFGWDDMSIVSVSGNYCTDKKPAAINWIEGRGKSVVAEATIPKLTVEKVLKSDVKALVELNISKNLVGSAMAGSTGGFNAHAANLLTAVFLALGQDPAQNVESSNCITLMKETEQGDLQISVSMPCIEVGTIGGGTILEPQSAMLDLLGVRGPHPTEPGKNARQLARIVASAVLAGELSLCAALAAGHLVQSHMTHNRAKAADSANNTEAAATQTPKKTLPTPSQTESIDRLETLKEGARICVKS